MRTQTTVPSPEQFAEPNRHPGSLRQRRIRPEQLDNSSLPIDQIGFVSPSANGKCQIRGPCGNAGSPTPLALESFNFGQKFIKERPAGAQDNAEAVAAWVLGHKPSARILIVNVYIFGERVGRNPKQFRWAGYPG